MRRALALTAAGILIGLIAGAVLRQFLSSFQFGVPPVDPVTFVGVPLLLAPAACAACGVPAWRALRVDPLSALRSE